jgi:hypothetical protein
VKVYLYQNPGEAMSKFFIAFFLCGMMASCAISDSEEGDITSVDEGAAGEGSVVSELTSLADPPEVPCRDSWYYETATTRVNRQTATFCGYNVLGQYMTCGRYDRCNKVDTYLWYTFCTPPVTMRTLVSSEINSCSDPFDSCPVPFFQIPC